MRVIKVGGRAQRDPALLIALSHAWRRAPGRMCVVHGGGDEITALQRRLGVETAFVSGRRVTSAADVELIRMSLSGLANKRLVSELVGAEVPAVGISGEDAACLGGEPLDATHGHAGLPTHADVALPRALLAAGFLPVFSPLSRDVRTGGALNVNGDDAARALAVALGAGELLLISDVSGVLLDGEPCAELDEREARALCSAPGVSGGMIAKLEAACAAIAGGVAVARIGGVEAITNPNAATRIAARPAARMSA